MQKIKRYKPNIEMGLTDKEVQKRFEENLNNYDNQPKTKSIKEIIISNLFTFFNLLNISLGIAVLICGLLTGEIISGIKNCLFIGVPSPT